MPLPLYGSGGRILRISAAIWPTCCLSAPRTTIDVGVGTSNVIQGCAVTHALDFEPLLESLRNALDHVRDQRPRQPVEGSVLAALGRPRDDDLAVVLLDLHPWRDRLRELPERPVHHHAPRGD